MMLSSTALRCASAAAGGRRRIVVVVSSSLVSTPSSSSYNNRSISSSSGPTTLLLKDSYEHVLAEKKENGTVGLITLHRPSALNALSEALFTDLLHAAQAFDQDTQIGCLVVTGSTKAFAAGADIKEMSDVTFAEAFGQDIFRRRGTDFAALTKPVIAAVNGYCLGGGCELAMMCDFILASDTAKFGQPEINLGIGPGMGGTQRLTKLIGRSKAMHMCLTGEMITAAQAETAGLVAKIYPSEELVPSALQMAASIASKGRMAVIMTKEAVNAAEELSLTEGLRLERRLFQSMFATADQKEGMQAFMEKRKPVFTNN